MHGVVGGGAGGEVGGVEAGEGEGFERGWGNRIRAEVRCGFGSVGGGRGGGIKESEG